MSASSWAPAEVRRLEEKLSAMTQRAEAAEARIKASQEQEPAVVIAGVSKLAIEIADANGNDIDWAVLGVGAKFYAAPVIPPDVAELQRENAELTRKLAEQQAYYSQLSFVIQEKLSADEWATAIMNFNSGEEELTKLLAEAKSKAVPEGMILVQADRITFGDCYRFGLNPNDIVTRSVAPQPGGSNE